jgi:putative nucleotidyltransferase with HDIG domain
MQRKITTYVATICVFAAAAALGVHLLTSAATVQGIKAAACFASLGFFAQAMGHKIGGKTQGNTSFIPFLAISLLSPNMVAVATVTVAVTVVEISARRETLKGIFNVAQYTLGIALGIIVYRLIGGVTFLDYPEAFTDFAAQPVTLFLPSAALVVVLLVVNNSAVSGAVSISEGRSFWETWRVTALRVFVYDVLSLPFVFMFVGAYTIGGPIGAVLLAAPLLAVRQLYKTNWQLQRTNEELLQLMVAAIEARDPYTSGHSRRVSKNARIIADALGLRGAEAEKVATAALLHDVGKIHEVFASILQKPGKLTPEERAIMETHSRKSAELISTVSHLHDLVKPVLHHHENWDGTGYPAGLKGDEIPLTSRIIMIADTIDAMTTDRPYRKALGEPEVRRELVKFKGIQFDPTICDAFMASPKFAELFTSVPKPTPLSIGVLQFRGWRQRRVTA